MSKKIVRRRKRGRSMSTSVHSERSSSYNSTLGMYSGSIGDIISNRYEIFNELGTGTFGRVLACIDRGPVGAKDFHIDIVAVKVIRSVERYVKTASLEAKFLRQLDKKQEELLDYEGDSAEMKSLRLELKRRGKSWCLKLLTSFDFDSHYCLVTEALGLSLYNVIKSNNHKGFSLRNTIIICRQLFEAIKFLQVCCAIVHTDLKLENILFVNDFEMIELLETVKRGKRCTRINRVLPESALLVKLIDFGGAYGLGHKKLQKRYSFINTRQYRSPEVTLGTGWSFPSDIWSAGCLAFEILVGDLLFQTHEELEHLALIEKITGEKFREHPSLLRQCPRRSEYFNNRNELRRPSSSRQYRSQSRFVEKAKELENSISELTADEDSDVRKDFISILRKTLHLNPNRRITATAAGSLFQELCARVL